MKKGNKSMYHTITLFGVVCKVKAWEYKLIQKSLKALSKSKQLL